MDVAAAIERAKAVLACQSDMQFAQKIGALPASISNWKKRNTLTPLLEHLIDSRAPVSLDQIVWGDASANLIGPNDQKLEVFLAERIQGMISYRLATAVSKDVASLLEDFRFFWFEKNLHQELSLRFKSERESNRLRVYEEMSAYAQEHGKQGKVVGYDVKAKMAHDLHQCLFALNDEEIYTLFSLPIELEMGYWEGDPYAKNIMRGIMQLFRKTELKG